MNKEEYPVKLKIKRQCKKLNTLSKFLDKYPFIARRSLLSGCSVQLYRDLAPSKSSSATPSLGNLAVTNNSKLVIVCGYKWASPEEDYYRKTFDPYIIKPKDVFTIFKNVGMNFSGHELMEQARNEELSNKKRL